ncbi:unnamed protein product [Anisakis simplex]|uniref:Uncharacterized protein n=1 Tax=Anisakis simplex TaxID=6269 RepID=A0A3P6QHN3_ANISI|nr:unnamed protein product [Anisakis simplex]
MARRSWQLVDQHPNSLRVYSGCLSLRIMWELERLSVRFIIIISIVINKIILINIIIFFVIGVIIANTLIIIAVTFIYIIAVTK